MKLNTDSNFPVGHNLGLNYYNDITVGVINNEPENYQLIFATEFSSYILQGNSLINFITVMGMKVLRNILLDTLKIQRKYLAIM